MNLAPATATDAGWVCGLLQISDSFFPTGSYAHSHGLEGLVQAGIVRDRSTLRGFLLESTWPALRQVELPVTARSWQALADADWVALGRLGELSHALKTAAEARTAAENIGRQRAELVVSLRGGALATEYLRRAEAGGWPFSPAVSAALEGRVLGAPLEAVLAGVCYATLAGLISAAMKLLRLGQHGAQTLLAEMLAAAPAAIAQARVVPWEQIGWFNPWLDIAAARHATSDFRLFIS